MSDLRKSSGIYSNVSSDLTASRACGILQALGSWQSGRLHLTVNQAYHTVVQIHHSPPRTFSSDWLERRLENPKVACSRQAGCTTFEEDSRTGCTRRKISRHWVRVPTCYLLHLTIGVSPSWLRHRTLIPTFTGSNPVTPAIKDLLNAPF